MVESELKDSIYPPKNEKCFLLWKEIFQLLNCINLFIFFLIYKCFWKCKKNLKCGWSKNCFCPIVVNSGGVMFMKGKAYKKWATRCTEHSSSSRGTKWRKWYNGKTLYYEGLNSSFGACKAEKNSSLRCWRTLWRMRPGYWWTQENGYWWDTAETEGNEPTEALLSQCTRQLRWMRYLHYTQVGCKGGSYPPFFYWKEVFTWIGNTHPRLSRWI